jgi:hypothetical protein
MPDPTDDKLDQILAELRLVKERQKLTAKSVADLSIGLNSAQTASRNRDAETHGLILGLRSEMVVAPQVRDRKNSEDKTDSFRLPSGDSVELTRRTQRRIVRWVLLAVVAIGLHAAQYLWERAAEHRSAPQSAPAPALPPH